MAIVSPIDGLHSISFYKKFGTPCNLGDFALAKSLLGDENDLYAVYRRRPSKKGETIVKMAFYISPPQRTDEQSIRRDLLQRAVSMWHNIGETAQAEWRLAAIPKKTRGYSWFLRSIFSEFKLYGLGVAPLGNQLLGKESTK